LFAVRDAALKVEGGGELVGKIHDMIFADKVKAEVWIERAI
jgi:hypothetical protein